MAYRDEVAWAAGLFEGEGTASISHNSGPGRKYWGVHASLSSTDRDVIERFRSIVGCGAIYRRPPGKLGKKPIYVWRVAGFEKTQTLLAMFWWWLGERRRARLLEVVAVGRQMQVPHKLRQSCPLGHPYDAANTYIDSLNRRFCRRCRALRERERRRRAQAGEPRRRATVGAGAINAAKTHCPQDHEYNAENTHYSYGSRKCRVCERERARAKRHGRALQASNTSA